jgi:hypothetical protein
VTNRPSLELVNAPRDYRFTTTALDAAQRAVEDQLALNEAGLARLAKLVVCRRSISTSPLRSASAPLRKDGLPRAPQAKGSPELFGYSRRQ